MINIFRNIKNVVFLCRIINVVFYELFLFGLFRNYDSFIENITLKLANINILYVKVFQAIALNNKFINEETNNKLMVFTDNAPWCYDDLDMETLSNLYMKEQIYFPDSFESPINSGMISLVYKCVLKSNNEDVIIKIKRKNIEQKLNNAIDNLLFIVYLFSFFKILKQYKIDELVYNNIDIIKHQLNFDEEVKNTLTIKENCKNLRYVKIPEVYSEITNKYPNVIMMEFINGVTINKISTSDYEGFAKQVLKFGFVTTVVHSFSHGDLHAGNILFIKDENDEKYPYKIGVLDFGIMYNITPEFKKIFFEITCDLHNLPARVIAEKLFSSGLFIEPLYVIMNLSKNHYDSIIDIITQIMDETINKSKQANQIKVYEFINNFNNYMSKNNLNNLGLRLSDNFIKTQLTLAMAHGVTLKLCKDNYMELADQVINELFHTNLIIE